MPKLDIAIPNPLSKEDAAEKLKSFADTIKEKFADKVKNVHEEWNEHDMTFGFTTMGMEIKGDVTVGDESVDVKAEIPFAAMMFKGRIEQEIRDAITQTLS